ncbi:uncharacterized protein LOC124362707 [Homalodisca vitripennis]|uniref:uncharacterized protein LOC124362707 n=1 Tax=Homalodisca vitripennis TaxID=197043 RepID=UPI001EEB94A2|nr:uncharacterized protein LOC124362707 [Homalodisca vitripennis]
MYRYLVLASMTNLLISCVIGLPSEVAEMPRKSPLDIVVEAKEGFGFNFVQRGLIKALNPKPIVDTITEEEKYGNTGENPLGRKVVKGVEGISNLVNSAFRVPEQALSQGSRKLTEILDNIGGRIVGLQK